jgi:uncharacterized membrane protein YecN with MAPEG domain
MIEFLSILLQLGFVLFAGYVVYLSCMINDAEKKHRRAGMRAGTHDYYGNKIDDSNNKKV